MINLGGGSVECGLHGVKILRAAGKNLQSGRDFASLKKA